MEFNNKTLMFLLILAMVFSLSSALVTFNRVVLTDLPTGKVPTQAKINYSIEQVVGVEFNRTLIDFGTGRVTTDYSNCTLDSSHDASIGDDCEGFNDDETGVGGNGLWLQNIGTMPAKVNVSFNKNTNDFLNEFSSFQIVGVDSVKPGSCDAGLLGDFTEVPDTPGEPLTVCEDLNFLGAADTIRIDVKLVIDEGVSTDDAEEQVIITAIGYDIE